MYTCPWGFLCDMKLLKTLGIAVLQNVHKTWTNCMTSQQWDSGQNSDGSSMNTGYILKPISIAYSSKIEQRGNNIVSGRRERMILRDMINDDYNVQCWLLCVNHGGAEQKLLLFLLLLPSFLIWKTDQGSVQSQVQTFQNYGERRENSKLWLVKYDSIPRTRCGSDIKSQDRHGQ